MKISQREARRLRKQVQTLETFIGDQKRNWSATWPGGVSIATLKVPPETWASLNTARRLDHGVVVATDSDYTLRFFGVKL